MEAQIPRHNGDEQLPAVMQGQGDGHHEKKSVIKNVKDKAKAKARKIKGTFTKHGHGHEQLEHDHHSPDEYDDDDEEDFVEDPEVHGAPMPESAAVRSGVGAGHQLGVNLEKPNLMAEDKYDSTITDSTSRPFTPAEHTKPEHGQSRKIERAIDENQENPRVKTEMPSQTAEDRYNTISDPSTRPVSHVEHTKPEHGQFRNIERGTDENQGNHRAKTGIPSQMGENRYNTITDPPTRPFSQVEHSQPEHGHVRNIERGIEENQGNPEVKIGVPTEMKEDPAAPKDRQEPSNYQNRVADPTHPGGAEAGITPILRSFDKMSVSDKPHPLQNPDNPPKMFTGTHDQFSSEPIPKNAPVDPKDPGSPLKALASCEKQSSYTEKISSATSALTDKAVAAKNIVASKLGYGEKEGSGKLGYGEKEGSGITNTGRGEQGGGGVTATVADNAQRAAATVTETLAPVTGKVAGVGSSVLSKVQGGPPAENKGPSKETTGETLENKGTGKGVTGYLAEKLRPGEEDKALSKVISDALYRKKPDSEEKPMGKVTVSDEVARQLGTKEDVKRDKEGVDAQVVGDVRPDVVERVKGWFGIGQSQSSQASQGDTDAGNEQFPTSSNSGGERRLQESAN